MFNLSYIFSRRLISNSVLLSASLLLAFNSVAHEDGHAHEQTSPRLVSAGAGVTELVLALDAGDELVAVDSTSQVPASLDKIEKLGYHRMLSAEGILALTPSLVLGTEAMGPTATLDVLKSANVNVVLLPSADNPSELMANIDQMGKLLQRQSQADALKVQLTDSFDRLAAKKLQLGNDSPNILFMLLQADRPARVGGEGTAADIIIKLAGGTNIADFSGYKSLSQEGILSLEPDLILIANRSHAPQEDDGSTVSDAEKVLNAMPLLAHTPAGKHKQIHSLPSQALLGGLGLSAINAADKLAEDLIKIKANRD